MKQLSVTTTKDGVSTFAITEKTKAEKKADTPKVPSKEFIITGRLSQNGKQIASVTTNVISAPDDKTAGRYAMSHARYLGLELVPLTARINPPAKNDKDGKAAATKTAKK